MERKELSHVKRRAIHIRSEMPWLKCIYNTTLGIEILQGIHQGFCGSHISARVLASKVVRQEFFWPTKISDAQKVTKAMKLSRKNACNQNAPTSLSQLITLTWPLQRWGIDLVGPLPATQGNCRFAIVAVEYFTKWIETKAISCISSLTVQKFLWQNIICKFVVPREIKVDNGKHRKTP